MNEEQKIIWESEIMVLRKDMSKIDSIKDEDRKEIFFVKYYIPEKTKETIVVIYPVFVENGRISHLILHEMDEKEAIAKKMVTKRKIYEEIQIIKDSYELEKYIQEKILPLSIEEVSLVEKYLRTNKTLSERNLTAIYCYQ